MEVVALVVVAVMAVHQVVDSKAGVAQADTPERVVVRAAADAVQVVPVVAGKAALSANKVVSAGSLFIKILPLVVAVAA
jgi:hypothetical protein